MVGIVETTKEASRGGFQGIKKVRGLIKSIELVPPKFTDSEYGEPKNQIEVTLSDACILEMFPGEEPFELKEGDYKFWVSYAQEGKTPHANSAYMKVWVASAEKLGKKPSDFIGQYVTLDKVETELFKQPKIDSATKKAVVGADGKKELVVVSTDKVFGFVADESEGSDNVNQYIKGLLKGLNEKAALHALLTDVKAKQFPKYRDALKSGTLGEQVGLQLVDGIFVEA